MFQVKICGVTEAAGLDAAIQAGADAVGLNFYSRSPRCVSAEQASALVSGLPAGVLAVGVFVELPPEQIRELSIACRLGAAQTYGVPDPFQLNDPVRHLPAFRVASTEDLDTVAGNFMSRRPPLGLLIDSYVTGMMGGTGRRVPWEILRDFRPPVPFVLAGGLTPDNVAEAIRLVRPDGVDVASGVESAPGRKDPGKVRAFVHAARTAWAELGRYPVSS